MPDRGTPITPARWIRAVLALFTLLGLGFGSWLSRIPSVRDHLGASTLEMSYIGLVLAIGCVLGLSISSRYVSWLGPRRTLAIGAVMQLVGMAAATTLLWNGAVIPGVISLAIYGFFFSTCDVAMNVSGADAERALGRPRMPLLHAGYSLGGVSATGLGAVAEAARIPVPVHLGVVYVVIAGGMVLALARIPGGEQSESTSTGSTASDAGSPLPAPTHTGPIQIIQPTTGDPAPPQTALAAAYSPWRDPRMLIIAGIALGTSLAEGAASDWLSLAMADGRGASNATATLILGTFFVSMTLGRLAGSWVLTRFGRVRAIRGTAVLLAIGVAVTMLVPTTWGSFVGAALWGVGSSLGFPVAISAAADDPKTAVRGVSMVAVIAYTAMLMGPMAFGFLGEHFGLLNAFWPLIFCAVFVLLAAPATRDPRGRDLRTSG